MVKAVTPKAQRPGPDGLTDGERRDIMLWFGWGAILGYDTSPRGYLREMMKPAMKWPFMLQPREKRRAILRFVIEENRRRAAAC